MDAGDVLTRVFGLPSLREGQREAVSAFLDGRDVLVVLPTGHGKSLCYQLPAVRLFEAGRGPTLVVSPLVALMDDQVRALSARGVRAACLHSGVPWAEQRKTLSQLREHALVYVSPERLSRATFRATLAQSSFARAVVDEAHCISEWGHDFRPEYRTLDFLRRELGVPVLAATATATPRVQDDIERSLALREPLRVVRAFLRPDLELSVHLVRDEKTRTAWAAAELKALGFAHKRPEGRALVYATTRKRAEAVQKALRKQGIKAGHYHAGRKQSARARAHALFEAGKTPVLVATSAYGMGIDLPDIRVVLHVEAPGTLEAYAQQAGRAGRDGKGARAILAYADGDEHTQRKLWGAAPSPGTVEGFRALQDYALAKECRAALLSRHFGHDSVTCGRCDACTAPDAVENARARHQEKRVTRAKERAAQARKASDYELDEEALASLVAFVDAMQKPLGRRLVVKALRGSRARDVQRKRLTQNPHFAALREAPEDAIFRGIDALLARGLLVPKGKKYPTLWVAGKGVRPRKPARASASAPPLELALKRFRQREAQKHKLKAYQVFQNRSLKALCEQRPRSPSELLAVWGMGEARVAKYGDALLALLREHAQASASERPASSHAPASLTPPSPSHVTSGQPSSSSPRGQSRKPSHTQPSAMSRPYSSGVSAHTKPPSPASGMAGDSQ